MGRAEPIEADTSLDDKMSHTPICGPVVHMQDEIAVCGTLRVVPGESDG
jgi:hypothetical protein